MQKTSRILLADEAATIDFGARIASLLQNGDVIGLSGALGSGKTTLARSIIQHLAGDRIAVPSPSFTLVQHYTTPRGTVAHYDWYRLDHAEDVYELGFPETVGDSISLIEWPECAAGTLPPDHCIIRFSTMAEAGRQMTLHGSGIWADKLTKLLE